MIFGKHTLDETRDLLATADYRFTETGKAYDALIKNSNGGVAVASDSTLVPDWTALSAKWGADRKDIANQLVATALRSFPLPSSAVPTEIEWKRILGYIQFQENVKGSLQDVTKRIETASGKAIMYPDQPRPGADTDVDTALFKTLDQTTRNMDAAADAAKKKAGEVATSNWGLLIGGTVLVTLIGTQVMKRYV